MKKLLLCCLAFLLLQGVCFADENQHAEFDKLMKQKRIVMTKDTFTNDIYASVSCENEANVFDPAGYWSVNTDFTIRSSSTDNLNYLTMDVCYYSSDSYNLQELAIIKLGNKLINLTRIGSSDYANHYTNAQYTLAENFFQALKSYEGDAILRVYYKTLTGQYYRDLKIPKKKISDIKVLFGLLYPELLATQK